MRLWVTVSTYFILEEWQLLRTKPYCYLWKLFEVYYFVLSHNTVFMHAVEQIIEYMYLYCTVVKNHCLWWFLVKWLLNHTEWLSQHCYCSSGTKMCNSSPKIIIFFFSCAHLDIASVCVRFNPRLTRFKETVFSRICCCCCFEDF